MVNDGCLREIKLEIAGMGTMSTFGDLAHDTKNFLAEFEDFLYFFKSLDGPGDRRVVRSLDIKFEIGNVSDKAMLEWLIRNPVEKCEEVLERIHKAMGGAVMIDGAVCFEGGKRVSSRLAEVMKECRRVEGEKGRRDVD